MVGQRIKHYQILEKIGTGGMGEVYEAEDTELRRKVALKILPQTLIAARAEALDRFKREARALAALNHPNIVTIFSVEEAEGIHFLTMERVAGDPLSKRIPKGGFDLPELCALALPLVDALAAAHEKGIGHRDLKPSNIMVDEQGHLKVIDFGIAKLLRSDTTPVDEEAVTQFQTGQDQLLGTPAYMSPEQIDGSKVDHRSDIFSLGVVLCEMATGQRPFKGNTPLSIIKAITQDPPTAPTELKPGLPRGLEKIVRQCLEKDPAKRYQTMLDVRRDLLALQPGMRDNNPVPTSRVRWQSAVAVAGVALAGVAFMLLQQRNRQLTDIQPSERKPPLITRLQPSRQITYETGMEDWPSWAPDGERIVYSADVDGHHNLFIKTLKSGEISRLTRTNRDDIMPAWNPANPEEIVFVRHSAADGKLEPSDAYYGFYANNGNLWKRNLKTGQETMIAEDAYNPSFSTNGMLALHQGNLRIWTCDSEGRRLEVQTRDEQSSIYHLEPSLAPDGSKLVFRREEKNASSLWVIDLKTRQQYPITKTGLFMQPAWSPTGRYIYFSSYLGGSGLNLWRLPVGPDGRPTGKAEVVTSGQGADLHPSLSPNGRQLMFAILRINSDIWKMPVDPVSGASNGPPMAVVATTREDSRGAWSKDEQWIAFNSDRDSGNMNLWIHPLNGGADIQITKGPGGDYQPDWSPNGKELVFFSLRSGNADIWIVDLENGRASGEPRQLTTAPDRDTNPFFSPDGTEIAFMSDRNGRTEIYVMNCDGSGQRPLSSSGTGGHFFRWRQNNVVFNSAPNKEHGVYEVSLDGKMTLFRKLPQEPSVGGHMSLSPDGSAFTELEDHRKIWAFPGNGEAPRFVYQFSDSNDRIDYPVWSPSGKWLLFDRMVSQGGDIYLVDGVE